MTLIWCLSPLVGFFLTPIMGRYNEDKDKGKKKIKEKTKIKANLKINPFLLVGIFLKAIMGMYGFPRLTQD